VETAVELLHAPRLSKLTPKYPAVEKQKKYYLNNFPIIIA